jgi:hypothetical protein
MSNNEQAERVNHRGEEDSSKKGAYEPKKPTEPPKVNPPEPPPSEKPPSSNE